MIRYHSFYPAHREGEYAHLMNAEDRQLFAAVRAFNPYDLYTKSAGASRRRGAAALLPGPDRRVSARRTKLVVWEKVVSGTFA